MLERPESREKQSGDDLPGDMMKRELGREPSREKAQDRQPPPRVVRTIDVERQPSSGQGDRQEQPRDHRESPVFASSCSTNTNRSLPKNIESPTKIVGDPKPPRRTHSSVFARMRSL